MSPTVLDCDSIRPVPCPAANRSIKGCRENYFINFAGRKPATNKKVPSITTTPLPIYQIICKNYQITLTQKFVQTSQHLDLAMVMHEFTPFRLSHTITALPQTIDATLDILLLQPQTLITRFFIPKCLISRFSRFKNRRRQESSKRFCNAPHFLESISIPSLHIVVQQTGLPIRRERIEVGRTKDSGLNPCGYKRHEITRFDFIVGGFTSHPRRIHPPDPGRDRQIPDHDRYLGNTRFMRLGRTETAARGQRVVSETRGDAAGRRLRSAHRSLDHRG